MNAGDFVKTLKRICYNEADYLDESDFISMTSQKELKSFFEVFCTLDENNVLTTEEIEEYNALTATELAEIELLKKSGQFEKNYIEHEKRKEAYFLQEQLIHLENHNKFLERQIDLFKKHEANLLQDKEIKQKVLLNAKKKFKTYELNKLPKTEEEFISSLKSTLEKIQDLQSLIIDSDCNDNKLPTSDFFKGIVQQYLETEDKVLQSLNTYMQTNFQFHKDGTLSFINNEIFCHKELKKEASFLKKKLKSNIMDNITSEMKIQKVESIIKYFESVSVSDFNYPSSQLRQKLDDAIKLNELLKVKEDEYKACLYSTISKYVDSLIAEVALSDANEVYDLFQIYTERISLPVYCLFRQKIRLEMMIDSLQDQRNKFQKLKELIQEILKKIKDEQFCLQERKLKIEKELSLAATTEKQQNPDIVVASSLHNILAPSKNFKVQSISSKISVTDITEAAYKILEDEENLKKKHEEDMKTLNQMENHTHSLESFLNAEENYTNWHQLEQSWNANLNNLLVKLKSLENNIKECNKDLDQKQKLLEKKRNLQLARNLFVYALMNRELFKKYIEDVKVAVENSSDYLS